MHGLYQRGGVWYCDVVYKGRRIRKALCPSRKASERILAKIKSDLVEEKYFPNIRKEPCPPFREAAEEYLRYASVRRKPSSIPKTASLMKRLVERFGGLRLDEITAKTVEDFQSDMGRVAEVRDAAAKPVKGGWRAEYVRSDTGRRTRRFFPTEDEANEHLRKLSAPLSVASKNRAVQLLKSALTKFAEWGMIRGNPIAKVRLLRGEKSRTRFLVPDEVDRLLSHCTEPLKSILTISFHSGMRFGEIRTLRRDQVDRAMGTILLTDTKNGDIRTVVMDETVKAVLEATPDRGPHYFPNSKGEPIRSVQRAFRRACRRSGLRDFRIHDARHTFCSLAAVSGISLGDIASLAGHRSLSSSRRYSHLSIDYRRKLTEIVGRALTVSQNPPEAGADPKEDRASL